MEIGSWTENEQPCLQLRLVHHGKAATSGNPDSKYSWHKSESSSKQLLCTQWQLFQAFPPGDLEDRGMKWIGAQLGICQ